MSVITRLTAVEKEPATSAGASNCLLGRALPQSARDRDQAAILQGTSPEVAGTPEGYLEHRHIETSREN